MSELGLDMLDGCLKIFTWMTGICIVIIILGLSIWDLEVPKDHCIKCGRVICNENYCPNCGMSTDSVDTYNYWNNPKRK